MIIYNLITHDFNMAIGYLYSKIICNKNTIYINILRQMFLRLSIKLLSAIKYLIIAMAYNFSTVLIK